MSKKKKEEFASLELPHKDVPHLMGSHYRVYSDYNNYKVIAAESALEALQASGIEKPYKVERDTILLYNLLNLGNNVSPDAVSAMPPANDTQPAAVAPTETQQDAPANVDVPAAELSNNDIDKLLQG
jgi:hypothetical protein